MPMPPKGEPIARYDTYLEAQRAVDFLSDSHFQVQAVTIVGTGLQMVERVTGRLTYGRVALAGAASGAWFGLIFGIVLSMFGGTEGAMLAGPLFGAAAGVLFGIFSYSLTRGRRDFTSASQIVASEYAVLCLAEQAGSARHLLGQLPGGLGRDARDSSVGGNWPSASGRQEISPYGSAPTPAGDPADSAGQPSEQPLATPAEEPALTYGEAIERQRQERAERERLEREGKS
jgi:hypothetical protein